MRDIFPEYYRPTTQDFRSLWEGALVVLDASVLLGLYEYADATVEETFAVLEALAQGARLWLPHQAALEYQRQRPGVIAHQETRQYDTAYAVLPQLRKLVDDLREKLGRHAYLDRDQTVGLLDRAVRRYEAHLKKMRRAHPNFRESDPIRSRLDAFYEGRVGAPFAKERLAVVEEEGKSRYSRAVPPGYADKEKPQHLRYGDLIFWLQTIEHAKTEKTDVIIVSNDLKEDWWTKPGGQLFGPRPELRAEFHAETGRQFYLYSHDRFLKWAGEYLDIRVDESSIAEIRDASESRQAAEDWVHTLAQIDSATSHFRERALPPVFDLPDYSKLFGKVQLPVFDLPDYSKLIGQVRFPILDLPDYSKLLGQVRFPTLDLPGYPNPYEEMDSPSIGELGEQQGESPDEEAAAGEDSGEIREEEEPNS